MGTLESVLILLASAVIVVVLFRSLHLPPLLGYLIVGVAVGPFALNWIPDTEEGRRLGEFGVVFLMFSIGLEFSLSKLFQLRRSVFGLGLAQVLLTLAAATLLRFTLLFLAAVPLVLLVALVAALFGIACISLAIGRLLLRRFTLPAVHPLVIALAGALVVFDLAVIPYAGVFALAAVAMAGLGLAVVTRLGSSGGWTFVDLNF